MNNIKYIQAYFIQVFIGWKIISTSVQCSRLKRRSEKHLKKKKIASIPGQISKQAWKIEARTKDGRLILQEYICDIRDVESNSFGGKFIGPREGKPSILHPRSKKKKKKWKDRSFEEKVRRFQTRLDKTVRCGRVEKHCVIT